jgi:hypothetical protein
MRRSARLATYIGSGIVAGAIIGWLVIASVTRSEWGMNKVRNTALGWLADRVQGDVRIGRVSGGGLLRGARVHDLSIIDERNRPFLTVDSADVSYDWRTLIGGDIILTHVTLYHPRVYLEKLPGDTAWNYQYVFEDTTPSTGPGRRRLIMFNDARIVNGFATVRTPVEPPIERGDTARMIIEQMDRGLTRVMHFDSLYGQLNRALWETPLEEGRMFDVRTIRGLAYVWREPVHISSARGKLTMRDSVVSLDFPDVRLPSSRGSVVGRVLVEDRNLFDLQIDLDDFAFSDIDWLYDRLPVEGGGRGRLRMQSQPDGGLLFLAENARLSTPGMSVSGAFGIVVGDSVYFTRVDLRASPLDVRVIERMLPNGLPVDGLLMGTVEVTGPISAVTPLPDVRAGPLDRSAPERVHAG